MVARSGTGQRRARAMTCAVPRVKTRGVARGRDPGVRACNEGGDAARTSDADAPDHVDEPTGQGRAPATAVDRELWARPERLHGWTPRGRSGPGGLHRGTQSRLPLECGPTRAGGGPGRAVDRARRAAVVPGASGRRTGDRGTEDRRTETAQVEHDPFGRSRSGQSACFENEMKIGDIGDRAPAGKQHGGFRRRTGRGRRRGRVGVGVGVGVSFRSLQPARAASETASMKKIRAIMDPRSCRARRIDRKANAGRAMSDRCRARARCRGRGARAGRAGAPRGSGHGPLRIDSSQRPY